MCTRRWVHTRHLWEVLCAGKQTRRPIFPLLHDGIRGTIFSRLLPYFGVGDLSQTGAVLGADSSTVVRHLVVHRSKAEIMKIFKTPAGSERSLTCAGFPPPRDASQDADRRRPQGEDSIMTGRQEILRPILRIHRQQITVRYTRLHIPKTQTCSMPVIRPPPSSMRTR